MSEHTGTADSTADRLTGNRHAFNQPRETREGLPRKKKREGGDHTALLIAHTYIHTHSLGDHVRMTDWRRGARLLRMIKLNHLHRHAAEQLIS